MSKDVGAVWASLSRHFGSRLIRPDHRDYDSARRVFNRDIDRRPSGIVRCLSIDDASTALRSAAEHELFITVRSSGHNVAGRSVADEALMIDLTGLKGVRVDAGGCVATARAGSSWGEFDHATQRYGLATTGGTVTTTGIPGLTLGGGIGWLLPSYGLTCDNLMGARVLTTDGDLLVVSNEQNAEILAALRGGGYGLGVVVELDYQLHPVPSLVGGALGYPINMAAQILDTVMRLLPSLSREVMISPALMWKDGLAILELDVAVNGSEAPLAGLLASLSPYTPLYTDLRRRSYCDMQALLDNPFRRRMHAYWKSKYVYDLPSEHLETLVEAVKAAPTNSSMIMIEHYHGAYHEPAYPSAFPSRDLGLNVLIVGSWTSAEAMRGIGKDVRRWARATLFGLGSSLTDRAYVNYLGSGDEDTVDVPVDASVESVRQRLDPSGRIAS